MKGVLYWINIGLLLALIVGSIIVWPTLPERIPIHFGLDGKADGWTDRSLWAWFLLPLLAVVIAALIEWMMPLVGRRPDFLNLPSKKAFMALSPERRRPVIDALGRSMRWMSLVITIMMGVIQTGSYRAALGYESEVFIMTALGISVVMMSLLSPIMLASVQSKIDAQTKAARLEREGSDGKSAPV